MTIGPVTNSVDVAFDDIFDNLDTVFTVHFEAYHKSNWGIIFDTNYLDLENKETTPEGLTRKVDLDITMVEISGFHRWDLGDHKLDLIVGGRYVDLGTNVGVLGGPTPVDLSQDWIDPLAGGRWIWEFAEGWSLLLRGDVGGFQVGSDFASQGLGLVTWQPLDWASIIAGYRAIYMDYEDGSSGTPNHFEYDATAHGPVIGLNFRW